MSAVLALDELGRQFGGFTRLGQKAPPFQGWGCMAPCRLRPRM
jgi:hypothetical protein